MDLFLFIMNLHDGSKIYIISYIYLTTETYIEHLLIAVLYRTEVFLNIIFYGYISEGLFV